MRAPVFKSDNHPVNVQVVSCSADCDHKEMSHVTAENGARWLQITERLFCRRKELQTGFKRSYA